MDIINTDLHKITKESFDCIDVSNIIELLNKVNDKDIVIMGPLILSIFYTNKNNVKQEIIVGKLKGNDNKENCDEIITNLINTKKTVNEYTNVVHAIMSQILLQQFGYYKGNFYGSPLFLVELQKHIDMIKNNVVDSISNNMYDPFEVYDIQKKIITVLDRINNYDLTVINEINDYDELINGKTYIEICIDNFMNERNMVLLNTIKNMIIKLLNYSYKRSPYFYAKLMDCKIYEIMLFNMSKYFQITQNVIELKEIKDKTNIINYINEYIIENIVLNDNVLFFNEYSEYINLFDENHKNKIDCDILVKYNAMKILEWLIKNEQLTLYKIYYCIFMTQNIELFKLLKFDINLAINFLKEILEKGLQRSFYFLFCCDSLIIKTEFDDGNNVLHLAKGKNLIDIIMKLYPESINKLNEHNESVITYHIKNKHFEEVKYLIKYDFDMSNIDNDGNTFLHCLCVFDNGDLLKKCLTKINSIVENILNKQNKKLESAMIVACQSCHEDMFYILKNFGANDSIKDKLGNTIYHYICKNKMCIGMTIKNSKNYFNMTPHDYCYIDDKFYDFR